MINRSRFFSFLSISLSPSNSMAINIITIIIKIMHVRSWVICKNRRDSSSDRGWARINRPTSNYHCWWSPAVAGRTSSCPDCNVDAWICSECAGCRSVCTSPCTGGTRIDQENARDNGSWYGSLFCRTVYTCAGCSRLAICRMSNAYARLLNLQKPK